MRVALIGCSATKLSNKAQAKNLYQGNLFQLSRAWVERRVSPTHNPLFTGWGILSAKHGLVMPDDRIEPYDLAMNELTRIEQKAWSKRVIEQLANRWGLGAIYTVLAGADYVIALHGVPFVEPQFRYWCDQHKGRHPYSRPGIGVLMQTLKKDTRRG